AAATEAGHRCVAAQLGEGVFQRFADAFAGDFDGEFLAGRAQVLNGDVELGAFGRRGGRIGSVIVLFFGHGRVSLRESGWQLGWTDVGKKIAPCRPTPGTPATGCRYLGKALELSASFKGTSNQRRQGRWVRRRG